MPPNAGRDSTHRAYRSPSVPRPRSRGVLSIAHYVSLDVRLKGGINVGASVVVRGAYNRSLYFA
jgi:hypothetical protein